MIRGKSGRWLLSSLSGFLLSAAWPVSGICWIIFIAWIPLLFLQQEITKAGKNTATFFLHSLWAMFIWNVCTTWWIINASAGGAAMAIIANSLLMATVLSIFFTIQTRLGNQIGQLAFVTCWMSFEYIHLRWDITWPWLNLGNCFAGHPLLIQWYEYTGVFGGTLWILLVNILLFNAINGLFQQQHNRSVWLKPLLIMILPILFSLSIFYTYEESKHPLQVVAVQPNIDPYNEKFGGMSSAEQLARLLQLTKNKLNAQTDFLIGPETAIVDYLWEHEFNGSEDIHVLKKLLKQFPKLNILIGASTLKAFAPGEPLSETARLMYNSNMYYDSYNTALLINDQDSIQRYHKSKLVPGVEKMPWPAVFKYIERFAIDLGGISGSLGVQSERSVFHSHNQQFTAAPIICYESVYGAYVAEYVNKGANFLAIITNDGWWGDTPGYKQHLNYCTLRAIEMRRSIVRSANTGISAIINQRGELVEQSKWWQESAIKAQINANNKITFYARFGDYLGIMAVALTIIILLGYFNAYRKPISHMGN